MNYEIGARGQPTAGLSYSVALFLGRITDAIVQGPEVGGRAFFRNAGKTHNDGAEVGITVSPVRGLSLSGAYTYARYRFVDYKVADGAVIDTLDGNRLPGVPEHFWRLGLRSALPGWVLPRWRPHDQHVDCGGRPEHADRPRRGCGSDEPAAGLGGRRRKPCSCPPSSA